MSFSVTPVTLSYQFNFPKGEIKLAFYEKFFNINNSLQSNELCLCYCHDNLLGQNFVQSGRGRCLLQDEGHSGSRPHSFPGWFSTFVFRNVPGTVLECVCICWFERNSSNLDRASEMRDSIRLNSWDSFLVILPSISSETCVIYSSLILGTDVFRDWPFLGCSSTYSVSLNFRERLRARYVDTLVGSVYVRTTWTHL